MLTVLAPHAIQGIKHSMNDNPGREIAIFTKAVKLPIPQRAAFLNRACSGDDSLRHRLEALLSASDRSGDFLEAPAIPVGSAGILPAIRTALASVLQETPIPARRKRRKNSETNFQDRRRKRKRE